MVVVCEKCETRFHLGDSRVPAEGARVRCSRCKHEFFVAPPGSGDAGVVDEVLADVARGAGSPRREAVVEPGRRGDASRAEPEGGDRSSGDFEEDWEFNDDSHPHLKLGAKPEPHPHPEVQAKPELAEIGDFDRSRMDLSADDPPADAATEDADPSGEPEMLSTPTPAIDPVESIRARDAGLDFSSPDDLGNPEDWDFVGAAETEPPLEFATEEATSQASLSSVDEPGSTSPSAELEDRPAAEVDSGRAPLVDRLSGVASIAGWAVVALAFSLGIWASLIRSGEGSTVRAGPGEMSISGLPITASGVRGRLVENALAGNLLVVSGELENTGSSALTPGHAVRVQLVSESGERIAGASAAAGRSAPETSLREWDPDRLRRDLERSAEELAQRSFRPGERIRFDAVFESIPESAAGWVFEIATSPSRSDPAGSLLPTAPLAWE